MIGCGSGFGKYCPVEETQFSFERVVDRKVFHDCVLDAAAIIDQLVVMIRRQSKAKRRRLDKGIERAAIGDIETHATKPRHLDLLIAQVEKRRHVEKRHLPDSSIFDYSLSADLSGGHVDCELWMIAFFAHDARLKHE